MLIAAIMRPEWTMQDIADVFAVAAIMMAALIVPFSIACLLVYERIEFSFGRWRYRLKEGDPKIVYVRRNAQAKYFPSLFITTWLTRVNAFVLAYVVAQIALRVLLRYDTIGPPPHDQPAWSYLTSMFSSVLLLAALVLPASFLVWAKQQIREHTWTDIVDEGRSGDRHT